MGGATVRSIREKNGEFGLTPECTLSIPTKEYVLVGICLASSRLHSGDLNLPMNISIHTTDLSL